MDTLFDESETRAKVHAEVASANKSFKSKSAAVDTAVSTVGIAMDALKFAVEGMRLANKALFEANLRWSTLPAAVEPKEAVEGEDVDWSLVRGIKLSTDLGELTFGECEDIFSKKEKDTLTKMGKEIRPGHPGRKILTAMYGKSAGLLVGLFGAVDAKDPDGVLQKAYELINKKKLRSKAGAKGVV